MRIFKSDGEIIEDESITYNNSLRLIAMLAERNGHIPDDRRTLLKRLNDKVKQGRYTLGEMNRWYAVVPDMLNKGAK